MTYFDFPEPQGLYDPQNEHEACGIGMIAHIDGRKSHDIVQNAITTLCNLEHRGGQSADTSTGDGAGMMTQIPHHFFLKQFHKEDVALPDEGQYGIGMIFFPHDHKARKKTRAILERIVREEGQRILGWRTVPVNDSFVGREAKKSKPFIRQIVITPSEELKSDQDAFERKLYVIRKRTEQATMDDKDCENFYICSLSTRTIVYKGMLIPEQLDSFYIDLNHPDFVSSFAFVHSRFSTNTFPSWKRSHPNRYTIHNGEFNTIKGNINWMMAREKAAASKAFPPEDLEKILPIVDTNGSDSSMFDNAFEFLTLSGRSLAHTAMMMIPEPWANDETIDPKKRDFYEYHSTLMEPWDGPAAIAFTNGKQIGACLDRNGLRPARYYVTKDDMIFLGSEVGALDVFSEDIAYKDRLEPGKMLLVDLEEGRIIPDEEIKQEIAEAHPYREWIDEHMKNINQLPKGYPVQRSFEKEKLAEQQLAHGYTNEEFEKIIKPLVQGGKDPVGSMGYDSPIAVLSKQPQLLYNYFKQLFAQVTNPPIDAIREELITQVSTTIGAEGNLVDPKAENCEHIRLNTPILSNEDLEAIRHVNERSFRAKTLLTLFDVTKESGELEQALEELFDRADQAIEEGNTFLILSDRGIDESHASIPALLAVSGLHHHLIRQGTRTGVSILLETGEAREVHHFSTLIGYGAEGINPYLVFDSLKDLLERKELVKMHHNDAVQKYIKSVTDGIMKVLSKMGISTIQSYRGAQIFEAIGINSDVINKYFTRTSTRIGGIGLDLIEEETRIRHTAAFQESRGKDKTLAPGDEYQYRQFGEDHQYNPQTIHKLQHACRLNDYELFKEYSELLTNEENNLQSVRGLLKMKKAQSVPIDEVESVETIVKRFKTGAMSYGAISQEAHEALAIAMNRIGGQSNSGEGGEDIDRFTEDENGDSRRSSIKQVASGRFGVKSHYLVNADEIQIKIAQGAKPGEGGHLPGNKVYPWIAEVRGSTPGVELISPPPHHDIYSIEDLAELIHNLKNANPSARVSVKLVSADGVGTIAAGVAKGRADLVLISGYDGGTGAAPRTSLKHAGLPWEIGLSETHQTLLLNGLRDRITVETDGKMMSGRDVVVASLLGAEEFGFSTAPLVILGCVMMRVCHLDTCPVGVATQNPELRAKFMGTADHVENFMLFVAQEVRELMAELGFRNMDDMIGRTDLLEVNEEVQHWKGNSLDLSSLLYKPEVPAHMPRHKKREQDHGIDTSLDMEELIPFCEDALEHKVPVKGTFAIRNINRVTGTILGSEISKRYGLEGLPEDTIRLSFKGSAGQSFGAFIPNGMTLKLVGDANDYVGKGLSGGKIIVRASRQRTFVPEENIIAGNVCFYGATSGEAYINGKAGERFCVRNSGAKVITEGVGDHACEYMTGGKVVVLGETGRNFAAGMSGGIAYVLDESPEPFADKCNQGLVTLEPLESEEETAMIYDMIKRHVEHTYSDKGKYVLKNWDALVAKFVRVVPKDYLAIQNRIQELLEEGIESYDAQMTAFEESKKQKAALLK
ncbi:glutamate synthase large subunit [Salisediminibacterium halotolerans]|uniref:Glutamate synthase (NADPH/NADH) large chain/glutamate synthase (Ferredoxin) n=1 Tax=Salisediminibacterium halotolerans TaxID=517425 RepID=A0A1H9WAM4_9BACI|nr:glutamate synthase large subunit [Salisediminibacterium haloalkalitolerans]SES30968.1 glutamate synthase (NADPH/NADH) large chain/glutamate synthase (ferredoxin) [Salisediminibacterium haloalkalitolerans]